LRALVALLIWPALAWAGDTARRDDPFPGVASAYLLSVNGAVRWAKDPDKPRAPASLTKVMTALVALEAGNLERPVTIDREAARESGTRIGLRPGQRVTARDLLLASLVASANDACRALAVHVAGSTDRFVRRMNQKARSLGLTRTRFRNPCGHDAPGHVSTARDLAQLTEAALGEPEFARMIAVIETEIRTVDGGVSYPLRATNLMLGRYEGTAGVKTGYTPGAGKCLIALARRNGTQALLVLLDAPDRWWDAEAMLERAFAGSGS